MDDLSQEFGALNDPMLYVIYGVVVLVIGYLVYRSVSGNARSRSALGAWMMQNGCTEDAEPASPFIATTGFIPIRSGRGNIGGHSCVIGFGEARLGQRPVPILFMNIELPRELPGTALIRQAQTSWVGSMDLVQLEATMFKSFLTVHARPRNLAPLLMHPDFMAWYEGIRPRPMIYLDRNRLCVCFQTFADTRRIGSLWSAAPSIIAFIEKSGALEKH